MLSIFFNILLESRPIFVKLYWFPPCNLTKEDDMGSFAVKCLVRKNIDAPNWMGLGKKPFRKIQNP